MIRLLLPPHVDKEQAAAYLLLHHHWYDGHQPPQNEPQGRHESEFKAPPRVEWVVVRPTDMVPDNDAEERGYHYRR